MKRYYSKKLSLFIFAFIILTIACFMLITGCSFDKTGSKDSASQKQQHDQANEESKNLTEGDEIILPEPKLKSEVSLEEALNSRRSARQYKPLDLEMEDISQLLWAAQGVTEESAGFRTAPSAGALYPLELFIVKSDGLYQYIPEGHKLKKLGSKDLRPELMKASLSQKSISEAAIDIVITAIYDRTTVKYGDRGIRYVHMEAGHACQNILLQSAALGLGAVPVGAFSDSDVQKVLGLSKDYTPLYIVPVGFMQ